MAITRHLATFVLAEHAFRPIKGEILLLGRQTVFLTPDQAQKLVEAMGHKVRSGITIDYATTADAPPKHFISDKSFFSLFTDASVVACDVSDYEGADIIFDLCTEPPPTLLDRFDFIYNGSVLDNVFDPAAAMRNVTRMMKPDGVAVHYEGHEHVAAAYFRFSEDWFFDYCALNDFADCQVYTCTHDNIHTSGWAIHEWVQYNSETGGWRLTMPMRIHGEAVVVAIAQKAQGATANQSPVQSVYRKDHPTYFAACSKYNLSARRTAFRNAIGRGHTGAPGHHLIGTIP